MHVSPCRWLQAQPGKTCSVLSKQQRRDCGAPGQIWHSGRPATAAVVPPFLVSRPPAQPFPPLGYGEGRRKKQQQHRSASARPGSAAGVPPRAAKRHLRANCFALTASPVSVDSPGLLLPCLRSGNLMVDDRVLMGAYQVRGNRPQRNKHTPRCLTKKPKGKSKDHGVPMIDSEITDSPPGEEPGDPRV